MPGNSYLGGIYLGGEHGEPASGVTPPPEENPGELAGVSTLRFTAQGALWAPPEPAHVPSLVQRGAVEKLQPGRYMLRHIAPLAASETAPGIYEPLGQGFKVLARTLYAEALPVARLPNSPDFHEGKYTLRMYDAGDFAVAFPNRDASDGRPWRDRFSTDGHVEFLEISRENEIEQIGVIVKNPRDRGKVTIEGYDGFFLLKKAFEQEWTSVIAPRDLIERYSGVYVATPITFPPTPYVTGAAAAKLLEERGLTATAEAGTSYKVGEGRVVLEASTAGKRVLVVGSTGARVFEDRPWQVVATFNPEPQGPPGTPFRLEVGIGLSRYELYRLEGADTTVYGQFHGDEGSRVPTTLANFSGAFHTLTVESDGRFVRAYLDGVLLGYSLEHVFPHAEEGLWIAAEAFLTLSVSKVVVRELAPFLMRGPEKGEYVLPGSASTYPTGGLHGRWYNYGGPGEAFWLKRIFAPDPRRNLFPDFIQNIQAGINTPEPPAGVTTEFYGARFFGAVYLDLEANPEVLLKIVFNGAVRAWVGKTQFGQQIIDDWSIGAAREHTVAITAASLGAKKGWFPIIIEYAYAEGGTFHEHNFSLFFFPLTKAWTDPGGHEVKVEPQLIPATSLSPIGCVDARLQGSSHFDIVTGTAKDFGYQVACEPRQLESGEFPGRIVPRARLGKDTDEIIEAGDLDKRSEVNNYTRTLDATDAAASLRAFGSGIADGKGSQIAFEAINAAIESGSLFDLQAWVNAGDIAFPALLAARAEAELGLRAGSWENIEGEPIARDRLADTFPLTGVLSQFRWHPGDGVRLWLPDVGLVDQTPRQILQVVRNFGPEGRTSSQVGFRSRPKDPIYALRTAIREATRPARAYQRQYVTRLGNFTAEGTLAKEAFTGYSIASLAPGEKLVGAIMRVAVNTSKTPLSIEINGGNLAAQTTALGGPWTQPVDINILPYAVPAAGQTRMYVRMRNTSLENAAEIDTQLILTLVV